MSARERLLRNGAAAAIQKFLRLCEHLLLVPLFLHAWGTEYYGGWLTLMVIPAAMSFADFGFGTAAATQMVHAKARGDQATFIRAFACGTWAIHFLLGVAIILGGMTGHYLLEGNFLSTGQIDSGAALNCIAMMIGARFLSFYQQIFEGAYIAAAKAHVGMNLHAGSALVSLILTAVCLFLKGTAVQLSALTLAWSIIYTLVYCTWAYRITAIDFLWRARPDWQETRRLLTTGSGFMAAPAGQIIMFQGCTVVTNALLGPVAVVLFNTGRTLTRTLTQMYALIISASMSELQLEIGGSNYLRARRLFRFITLTSLVIGIVGSIALALLGPTIYQAWIGSEISMPASLTIALLAGVAASAFWLPAQQVFLAANQPSTFAIWSTGAAVFSIALSYVMGKMLGIVGIALACSLYDVVLAIALFPRACTFLRQTVGTIIADAWCDLVALKR